MEYTDGMEKIRGYLTKEQINAYTYIYSGCHLI